MNESFTGSRIEHDHFNGLVVDLIEDLDFYCEAEARTLSSESEDDEENLELLMHEIIAKLQRLDPVLFGEAVSMLSRDTRVPVRLLVLELIGSDGVPKELVKNVLERNWKYLVLGDGVISNNLDRETLQIRAMSVLVRVLSR